MEDKELSEPFKNFTKFILARFKIFVFMFGLMIVLVLLEVQDFCLTMSPDSRLEVAFILAGHQQTMTSLYSMQAGMVVSSLRQQLTIDRLLVDIQLNANLLSRVPACAANNTGKVCLASSELGEYEQFRILAALREEAPMRTSLTLVDGKVVDKERAGDGMTFVTDLETNHRRFCITLQQAALCEEVLLFEGMGPTTGEVIAVVTAVSSNSTHLNLSDLSDSTKLIDFSVQGLSSDSTDNLVEYELSTVEAGIGAWFLILSSESLRMTHFDYLMSPYWTLEVLTLFFLICLSFLVGVDW